ncbi:MAG: hypothetical protein AAF430_13525 [Myxococcota bacterium]
MRLRHRSWIVACFAAALACLCAPQAQARTLLFEATGDESGITVPGACCFSIDGTTFDGGPGVFAPMDLALTASGTHAYQIQGTDSALAVTFDPPVDSVQFFFAHTLGAGTAVIVGPEGQSETLFSQPATTPGDPASFVRSNLGAPIHEIQFFALGTVAIDDFRFERTPAPIPFGSKWSRALLGGSLLVVTAIVQRWRWFRARARAGLG